MSSSHSSRFGYVMLLALYRDYFATYVQRDVRKLINVQDLDTFTMFVRLLAGRVGQLLNRESLARDVGVSVPTSPSISPTCRTGADDEEGVERTGCKFDVYGGTMEIHE